MRCPPTLPLLLPFFSPGVGLSGGPGGEPCSFKSLSRCLTLIVSLSESLVESRCLSLTRCLSLSPTPLPSIFLGYSCCISLSRCLSLSL